MAPRTYPPYLREKARALRRERKLTIDQLAERLALPRTTIYYWVRDLPIPRTTHQSVAQRKGARRMLRGYRELREAAYAEERATFAELAQNRGFRDFVTLYVAEGYKRNRRLRFTLQFRSSGDPARGRLDSAAGDKPRHVFLAVPRRPKPGQPTIALGWRTVYRSSCHPSPAQVEQQPTAGANVAESPRRPNRSIKRHIPSRSAASVDGSPERGVVTLEAVGV